MDRTRIARSRFAWLLPLLAMAACGCQTVKTPEEKIAHSNIPGELSKVSMPEYVVEPPDLLYIEVLEANPGRGLNKDVERLVRPDGKISLDFYGELYVAGLTLQEVKVKLVTHLRKFIPDETLGLIELDPDDPEQKKWRKVDPADTNRVYVDVSAYNSKVYYVWGDVASPGRMPITGNETVLDALYQANGLLPSAAPRNIRLVRPAPRGACCEQVLPVNLAAITNGGDTTTNYQLMPGDRLVVYRDPIERVNNFITRLSQPFGTVVQNTFLYALAARNVANLRAPVAGVTPRTLPSTTSSLGR